MDIIRKFLFNLWQTVKTVLGSLWQAIKFGAAGLWRKMSKIEKSIIAALLLIALFSGGLYAAEQRKPYDLIPDFGGNYTEGILVSDTSATQELGRLTSAGLVRFSPEGEIVPDLAERWEIGADNKTYKFFIREGINANDLVEPIKQSGSTIPKANVSTEEGNALVFKLDQEYSPLLGAMSAAIFPYGPFEVTKKNQTEVKLKARKEYFGDKPYISQITLKYFTSGDELRKAVEKKEVNGMLGVDYNDNQFTRHDFEVPCEAILFINMRLDRFTDLELRQKIVSGQGSLEGESFSLLAPASSEYDKPLISTIEQLQKQGAGVNIIRKEQALLIKDNILPREYDLLLFGIDYGTDYDPYPFWHSSQVKSPGNNFSGFKNFTVDKILEEARLTTDKKTRADRYREFNQILDDEAPAKIFPRKKVEYAVSNSVKGINIYSAITQTDRFVDVNKWYIKVKKIQK